MLQLIDEDLPEPAAGEVRVKVLAAGVSAYDLAPFFPSLDKLAKSDNAWYRATLSELLGLLAAGSIKPMVAERIPLAEAFRAHAMLESGGHAGKFVLVTDAWDGPVLSGSRR